MLFSSYLLIFFLPFILRFYCRICIKFPYTEYFAHIQIIYAVIMTTPVNLSNGCVDVLVVEQKDNTLKSTPFQIAFANIKQSNKNKQVTIEINGVKSQTKMYIDKEDLRPKFKKIRKIKRQNYYIKNLSDSEEISEQDKLSERSSSRERGISPNRQVDITSKLTKKSQQLEALKNQAAPVHRFWPFAWLSKKKEESEVPKQEQKKEQITPRLDKIQEEIYEGEDDTTSDPQFQLSLCGQILRKSNPSPMEILQIFYKNQIKYKQFLQDPLAYLSNQDLVVKIDDSIYAWDIGLAIITCKMAFGKKMPEGQITKMMQKKKTWWLSNYFYGDKRKYVIQTDQKGRPLGSKNPQAQQLNGKQECQIVRYSKTPTSQQLMALGLKKGANIAKFTLDQTGQQVQCHIFLWNYRTKIVVSDIDGTITKTDVFGQLMPVFKHSWIHDGVVDMFNKISQNKYQIVYLTARAIVQYNQTREFLFHFLKQGQQRLPLGPVFTSPDGLFTSFKREMIDKQPDFLKTQILTVIRQTFPIGKNPLVGGFGNKNTDAISYKNSGIKLDKIFIIGQNSIVNMINNIEFKKTYTDIAANINDYFPSATQLLEIQSKQQSSKTEERPQLRKPSEQLPQRKQSLDSPTPPQISK